MQCARIAPVRVHASQLLLFVAAASAAVGLGVAMLRTRRLPALAWLILATGLGSLALLVLLHLTGRLGLEHLWFRAPSFYVALAVLAWAGFWWLRRPAPPALRFGLPAVLLVCVAGAGCRGGASGQGPARL